MINQDEHWLNTQLEKQNIKNYSDILLAYVDLNGTLTIKLRDIKSSFPSFKIFRNITYVEEVNINTNYFIKRRQVP